MFEYQGIFEAHISMSPINEEKAEIFKNFCQKEGIKAIQIVLARGTTPIQPMSSSIHRGTFSVVKVEVENLVKKIAQMGFEVKRMKIEASPENQDIPQNQEELAKHSDQNYFEHHWKILLQGKPSENLRQLCANFKAHFSQNAFKKRGDNYAEHFVTIRLYQKSLTETQNICEDFTNHLEKQNIEILKSITEYCVYDDYVKLDAEWLELSH